MYKHENNNNILQQSLNKAFKGGVSGASAMFLQVGSLMWLRTTMNYQYRHGINTTSALKILYSEGKIPRFYRGVVPALFQGPLSRFGDTACNVGVINYLDNNENTKNLPVFFKTLCASFTAGLWRIFLMPIDTLKTTLQVNGKSGFKMLKQKIKSNNLKVLYYGSTASFSATYVGHFPWFFTFNYLNKKLPEYNDNKLKKFSRNALIGFSASGISDLCSNSIRVIKTTKQSHSDIKSYRQIINEIIKKQGINSLLFRGLKTRILSNGMQGMMFTVLWKYFMDIEKK